MLDQAFESLKKFDWGTPLSEVSGIEDAVVASHADAALRQDVERRLTAALATDISRDAKDYVCRKLAMIGSSTAVPALAGLLPEEAHSHLARHALERIPGPEAAAALNGALPKVAGKLKIGVIGSLATRHQQDAVPALAGLLNDSDPAVARSAVLALGTIGGPEATRVLQEAMKTASAQRPTVIDALLRCAESLLDSKKASEAAGIYQSLSGDEQPRLVRLAATRGLLACLN
ncbi:MAG TPA: HEAT repeat domain-containing protein, partial [Pirellulales bacterium]|nr:HEAT repeat domain-containing protein [Pirellulales bacterium]